MPTDDATRDPDQSPLAFGQRLKILRLRRGMTREVLAGFMGRSTDWVKQLETGKMQPPRLVTILQLAEALRLRDLSELIGGRGSEVGLFIGPTHARLAKVAAAVNALPAALTGELPTNEGLRGRLGAAWTARHSSPNHREILGALLPDLIRDAQLAVRHADTATDRRAAQALLAETYALAQFFAAYQPDSSLLWRISERGMVAAQESEDPRAIGVASWLAVQAYRDSAQRNYEAAEEVTARALEYLEPLREGAAGPVLAIIGALRFEAGFTAARRHQNPDAWGWWDRARQIADQLPDGYYDPVTSFSREIMGAHATTVAVELHQGGESVRQAARSDVHCIPSRPRRARHRIEQARAYQLDGQHETALATIQHAWEAAPETVRYNGFAKAILLEGVDSPSVARRQRASALAVQVGLLAA
ncbi:XRE family transcriptional regulator [Streptacidiphilus pinicola]|uniref:XRE family transcriptional regulator n=1 Tax=Streptacidiphilus pinicola TaxID=2219663 RepID=A0A2X0ICX4_9ACTN|nr:helix-turn-helix transcriptional regulator [Streptacidiphilus pinicola]RAG81231.1 XRE family transcriptional regulator [Streptacidiphilus pinicola]